jgi:hypothetical protein
LTDNPGTELDAVCKLFEKRKLVALKERNRKGSTYLFVQLQMSRFRSTMVEVLSIMSLMDGRSSKDTKYVDELNSNGSVSFLCQWAQEKNLIPWS